MTANLYRYLEDAARLWPEKIAVQETDRETITYRDELVVRSSAGSLNWPRRPARGPRWILDAENQSTPLR